MITKIGRKALSQMVSEGILTLIEDGQVAIGSQIPTENELIEMFGVSRTSVREAVKSLTALGVLDVRPGIGTFVISSPPGPLRSLPGHNGPLVKSDLLALLEFRRIFECEVASLAATRATSADIEEMHRCVAALENGVAAGLKPPEDLGFHLALARATKNMVLVDVSSLIIRFYQKDVQMPDYMDVIHHRQIYEAIKNRDPEAAREAMRIHLDEVERRYQEKDQPHS
jgi:GntR family transcriptional repressor for pyruvate dehydrogenase complex